MTEITLIPAGGLANRMKAMAAGRRLAEQCRGRLDMIWFQDWGLGCRFDDLFAPLPPLPGGGTLREASLSDLLLRDRPRRRNLWLPRLFERLSYDVCLDEREVTRRNLAGFDFATLCRGRRVWLSSHIFFITLDIPDDIFDEFRPLPQLEAEIGRRRQALGNNVVGVHIRRTDNVESIRQSPTELFVQRMRQESADTVFYLATDSEAEKATLRGIFGPRIVTSESRAERGTLQGMRDAVIEMYLLSRTRRILGSAASTYSRTAASIGRIPLEIMSV